MPKSDIAIKSGTLRHLCNILQPVAGSSGLSGPTTALVPFAQFVPCGIEPASARDIIRSGQTVSEVIIPITIRWMPGVQANFVIQFIQSVQGAYSVVSTYIVQGVLNVDERSWKMTLACLALANNT